MFAGKRFRLKTPTLALEETGDGPRFPCLPAGSIISVVDGPEPDNPLLIVVWDKRWLLMFKHDIRERGEDIAPELALGRVHHSPASKSRGESGQL